MRARFIAFGLALFGLPACNVSYESADGNDTVRAGRNQATGRIEAEVRADGRGVRADLGRGGELSVGDATIVNLSDGDVRATIRTRDNRTISITANQN